MRFSATALLNVTALTGVAALMLYGATGSESFMPSPDGVDPTTTASVSAHAASQPIDHADQYMVFDHNTSTSCIVKLHRAEGYEIHRIEPGDACGDVSKNLAQARIWRESNAGLVKINDRQGRLLMSLVRGDGFAWEVIQPSGAHMSFQAF